MDIFNASTEVVAHLGALTDENRLRILALLDQNEFTVNDLTAVLQLPQSTVSRHLKVLADDAWIRWRQDGTSRHYRMARSMDGEAAQLWAVVRGMLDGAPWLAEDGERARRVLARRRQRSEEFFSGAAQDWDALRAEMFGPRTELMTLFGLLDPAWTVADLGSGTGALAEMIAPFVANVVAVGFFSGATGLISPEAGEQSIQNTVRPQLVDVNLKAFNAGYEYAKRQESQ